jgi:hypothetical protein
MPSGGPVRILDADLENLQEYGLCGYKDTTHPGYKKKLQWLRGRGKEGLRIKVLYSDNDARKEKRHGVAVVASKSTWMAKKGAVSQQGMRIDRGSPASLPATRKDIQYPYGIFSVVLNGRLVADHPISSTRFRNIMKKAAKGRHVSGCA